MKDKRQRLQSIVWPYNLAAAAAAAADQSGLYAYVMQSTAVASLLHAQSQYSRRLPSCPPSLSTPSSSGSSALVASLQSAAAAAAASSPMGYLAASAAGTPFPLPSGTCSDRPATTWDWLHHDAVYRSLMSLPAARHRASALETPSTERSSSANDGSASSSTRSLFRPYQSPSVGVASD